MSKTTNKFSPEVRNRAIRIRTLEASAGDDVIDLFDAVTTLMVSEASSAAKLARLRSLRDLDAAALKLRDAAIVILDPETPDDGVRTAIFDLIDRQTLDAAVERVGTLAEPHNDTYFTELRKHNRKIAYMPGLLAGLDLGAAPAGRPLLEAIDYLRVVHSGRKRAGPPPTALGRSVAACRVPQARRRRGCRPHPNPSDQ